MSWAPAIGPAFGGAVLIDAKLQLCKFGCEKVTPAFVFRER